MNYMISKSEHLRFYGVVVSTLDFESSDLGSTPGRTFSIIIVFMSEYILL